jgi:excinuclease ABC subunit B
VGITKRIKDIIEGFYDRDQAQFDLKAAEDQARYEAMSEKQLAREIKRLEKQMLDHARNLEFEKAAEARDQLIQLKKSVFGVVTPEEEIMKAG